MCRRCDFALGQSGGFLRMRILYMAFSVAEFQPESSIVAEVRLSPNHGERKSSTGIDMLVLHYTGMRDSEAAIRRLCTRGTEVSAHYVVLEDGRVIQCVPEVRRAWHAGQASWHGETDINSCSIGIELANPGHEHGYTEFPRRQIAALTALCRSILTRHRIPPHRVLGHSDVAPARKQDPGEKFPWRILASSGIGMWVKPAPFTPNSPVSVLGDTNPMIAEAQVLLARHGYSVNNSGYLDGATRDAIAAFQRHFRQERVDGLLDSSTLETLKALHSVRELAA
jgi:N-acetylmuramoyl-L-alanine amidase